MNAARLPAGFSSTAYALQELAFFAKDALLVIDDFAPNRMKDRTLESIAEKLFRAAGNQQGRSRMNKDGRPSGAHAPRALVLATGEEVPQGQSIRARLLIIDVGPQEVDRATLTECQKAGQQGRSSASMGAFLVWMAGQYDGLQQRLCARVEEIRGQFHKDAVHARLPSAAAALEAGFEIFLEFAAEIRAWKYRAGSAGSAKCAGAERIDRAPSELSTRRRSSVAIYEFAANRTRLRMRSYRRSRQEGSPRACGVGMAAQITRSGLGSAGRSNRMDRRIRRISGARRQLRCRSVRSRERAPHGERTDSPAPASRTSAPGQRRCRPAHAVGAPHHRGSSQAGAPYKRQRSSGVNPFPQHSGARGSPSSICPDAPICRVCRVFK
jgi:hypothetical protein